VVSWGCYGLLVGAAMCNRIIPDRRVMVSEDEHVWLFFGTMDHGSQTEPICFFVPQASI
jgi:hypothetical protein